MKILTMYLEERVGDKIYTSRKSMVELDYSVFNDKTYSEYLDLMLVELERNLAELKSKDNI